MKIKVCNIVYSGDLTWTDYDCVEPELPKEFIFDFPKNFQGDERWNNLQELIEDLIEEATTFFVDSYQYSLIDGDDEEKHFTKKWLEWANPDGYYWYCDNHMNLNIGLWSRGKFYDRNMNEFGANMVGHVWFGERINSPRVMKLD